MTDRPLRGEHRLQASVITSRPACLSLSLSLSLRTALVAIGRLTTTSTTTTTTVTTTAIGVRQFYGDMSSSNQRYGDDFSRGGPAPHRQTVAQYYCNNPKRLCYAIAARNRRYADQTMARLIELQSQRALNDKELEQWRKAEKWIFDEGRVEQLLITTTVETTTIVSL